MSVRSVTKRAIAIGGATVLIGGLAACSSGGSADEGGGKVEITYQADNAPATAATAKPLIEAFEKANPDITVKFDTRPQGTDGDNLIKTRLSTGEAADVFNYNSGSLMQALNPDNTLVDLSDEKWASDVDPQFTKVVSTDKGMYGAPFGTSFGGAVLYNTKVYDDLGLKVPTTWDEFISNSEKIKDAGDVAPIIQTYGDTWTSQLFVLGDFANITAQDDKWADDYTANKESYADEPALAGFEHLAEGKDKDLYNEDYASATQANGLKMLADGTGAQYPMLTNAISAIQQDSPDAVDDIGAFALPAEDAADTNLTIWEPNGLYIPKTTTGDKLAAAKKFVAFANSTEGCQVQNDTGTPAGPYVISTCSLPDDVPPMIDDLQQYLDDGKASPALEFLSPIKGPNLEKICVQVGSGITTASKGADQYDDDVVQQAQQLGIKGW
ncbi:MULTISPECIES: ABC transporter substrate-binding protein [Curtobacterium]|jgi:ABC-type glycerol-3-phosphate transport system substrate-binding protein|uniref:ABC transporter substrate-binding protein n=1 Tax=Curtobacterium TaxID=2034 RepID=UPI000DA729D5|nr:MULTISPECIES: ABC transporter substrate-binding protein [Curtobacterium]MCS6559356.1 ABC transporter substrate-binding protein [Curtobacterium flaccumfaciens]PZE33711.1 carbohydrate ABC transporter substrate-binding protein [Curtobacterium sp. MCLR17_055]PZE56865.1 carbohydrate ABC transporter substrate-binding protein [Curtobacterium sp. MCLR17_044]PZE68455.1 carbohydrate ABC transporter substrate-binding protein [Curtobacterium sp. MCLR17_059]PZF07362.1 carbohydrate ABC transporter substr